MNFELGKEYIVKVSEEGIIPIEEFRSDRFFDIESSDLDFLTDEEKTMVINDVIDKIKADIKDWQIDIHDNENDAETHDFVFERIYEIFDEYKVEREVSADEISD